VCSSMGNLKREGGDANHRMEKRKNQEGRFSVTKSTSRRIEIASLEEGKEKQRTIGNPGAEVLGKTEEGAVAERQKEREDEVREEKKK